MDVPKPPARKGSPESRVAAALAGHLVPPPPPPPGAGNNALPVLDAPAGQGPTVRGRWYTRWWAIALPVVVSIPWVAFMSLWKWAEDVFSLPAAIAAAFLLSSVLLAIRKKNLPARWAILPLACWIYECLPLTLPGPFDEMLTIGGSGMDVFWAWITKPR